jgi:hypothetical protein
VGPKNAPGREDLADVKSVQYQVDRGSKRRRRHPWDKQVEPPLGPASDRAMAEGRIYGSATGVLVRPELLTEINEDLYRNGKNGGVIQILYFSETERRRRRSRGFLLSDVRPPSSARRLASLQHVSTEKWLYVKKWI